MKFIAAALGLLLCGSLEAQALPPLPPGQTLKVDEAEALALANNLGLRAEGIKTSVKKRETDLAWNKLVPTASVSSSVLRLNTATTQVQGSTVAFDPWIVSGSLSTQWTLSLALFHGMDQTVIDYQNSLISLETAKKKLVRDVRKAFNQLLALQESIRLTQKQIANAEDRYRQTLASYQSGLASNVAVLQAQVSWENLKPTLEGQKLGYKQAMRGFAFQLGLDVNTPLTLVGSIEVPEKLPPLQPDSYLKKYLDQRFDVQAVQGSLRSLENVVKLQEDQLWPLLSLGWTVSPALNQAFDPKTDWGDSKNWKDSQGAFTVTLRWQLDSLVPMLSTWTAAQATKDTLAQTKIGLEQVRTSAVMEIFSLTDQIGKSAQSLDTLALNVELAQKSSAQTEKAYRAGSQTLADVQGADLQLQTAQYQVLNEKLTLVNALLDLEYALNAPKEDFLKGDTQ